MEAALRAIAEPRRLEILRLVAGEEMASGEIAAHFEVSRPAFCHHVQVLTAAVLLCERRDGTRRLYSARPEGLAEVKEFLESFWDERLERLTRAAEAEQRRLDRGVST
jgi:DNA-binding transcriptional ArsR family regulator